MPTVVPQWLKDQVHEELSFIGPPKPDFYTFCSDRGMSSEDRGDFYNFLRNKKLDPSHSRLHWLQQEWASSKKRGRYSDIVARKRRQQFGPGKFWGYTAGTFYLNQKYVRQLPVGIVPPTPLRGGH